MSKRLLISVLFYFLSMSVVFAVGSHVLTGVISPAGDQRPVTYRMWDIASPGSIASGNCLFQAGYTYYSANIGTFYPAWQSGQKVVAVAEKGSDGNAQYAVSSVILPTVASSQSFPPVAGIPLNPMPAVTGTIDNAQGDINLDWPDAVSSGLAADIAGYKIYRNGTYLATSTSSAYEDKTGTPGTTYTYAVKIIFDGAVDSTYLGASSAQLIYPNPPAQTTLTVAPTTLAFNYTVGGAVAPVNAPITVTIANGAGSTWTSSVTYVDAAPVLWLQNGINPANDGVGPTTVTITPNPAGITVPGDYRADVAITSAGAIGSPQPVRVTLHVAAAPQANLDVSTNTITTNYTRGDANPTATFTVANSGTAPMIWTVAENPASNILSLDTTGGTIAVGGPAVTVTVTYDPAQAIDGANPASIRVASVGAIDPQQDIAVTLNVSPAGVRTDGNIDDFEGTVVTTDATLGNGDNNDGYYLMPDDVPPAIALSTTVRTGAPAGSHSLLISSYPAHDEGWRGYGAVYAGTAMPINDIHSYQYISFYAQGNGSTAALKIQLKDQDGSNFSVADADTANLIPLSDTSWKQYFVPVSAISNRIGADGDNTINLDSITEYQFVITGAGASGGAIYIDDIQATNTQLAPVLTVVQPTVDLTYAIGGAAPTGSITVSNTGNAALDWAITVGLPAWLTANPMTGTGLAANGTAPVALTVNTAGLVAGDYPYTMNFTSSNGGGTDSVTVTLHVTDQPVPVLTVVQPTADLTYVIGGAAPTGSLTVSNTGTAALNWAITANLPAWLTAAPMSGTGLAAAGTAPVALTVNTAGLTPGDYPYTMNFTSSNNGGSDSVLVTLHVTDTANQAPTKPTLVAPANNATNVVANTAFSWNLSTDPEGDQFNYVIAIGDALVNPQEMISQTLPATTTSFTPAAPLTEGKTYYWSVVAVDEHGAASLYDTWSFTVASTPKTEVVLDDYEGVEVNAGANATWAELPTPDDGYYTFAETGEAVPAIRQSNSPDVQKGDHGVGISLTAGSAAAQSKGWTFRGFGGILLDTTTDISAFTNVKFWMKGDGTQNVNVKLQLKDATGNVYAVADTDTANLKPVSSVVWTEFSIPVTALKAQDTAVTAPLDTKNIVEYQFVFTGVNASAAVGTPTIFIDYVRATNDTTPPVTTGPVITSITPSKAAPGDTITIKGQNLGALGGTLKLASAGISTVIQATDTDSPVRAWSADEITFVLPTLSSGSKDVSITTSDNQQSNTMALEVLGGTSYNYPNPFNPKGGQETTFVFSPKNAAKVGVYIFDTTARNVKKIFWEAAVGGDVTWNGRNYNSEILGDGVYLYRVVNEADKSILGKGKILIINK